MANHRQGFQEEALPSKLNFAVWGKIFSYALRHPFLIIGAFLCMLVVTFYDSSFVPVMNSSAIEACGDVAFFSAASIWEAKIHVTYIFNIQVDYTFLTFLIVLIIAIALRCVMVFANFIMVNFVSMKIMLDLRKDTFDKISELSFSYFDKNSSGWLIARMQSDTAALGDVIAWGFGMFVWNAFELIFALITMMTIDIKLSLISLCLAPIIAIAAPIIERIILKAHRRERAAQSYYVSHLSESIEGAKTVKTLAMEENQSEQNQFICEDISKKRKFAIQCHAYLYPLLTLLSGATTAILIMYTLNHNATSDQTIEAATLVLFISLIERIFDPLLSVADILSDFFGAQASAEKVAQLLNEKIDVTDKEEVIAKYGTLFSPKKEAFPALKGDIVFSNVSFSYETGGEVLHNINLSIKHGTSIALVGETGSGKTTLANLICRFYNLTEGKITIDGVSIEDLSLSALRSQIGYVQQTPFIFNRSFFDNISFGNEKATLEDVIKASKEVGIHDFIMSFDEGYDHILSDGGASLSQGQKQLICLARALVRNPSILIMDEATSSIDAISEQKVQHAVSKLLEGRTSIIIAHRLSTIRDCSRILVLEKGEIIEDGNHLSLLKQNGKYASLYRSQFDQMSLDEQLNSLR